jgi:hypothetical protein
MNEIDRLKIKLQAQKDENKDLKKRIRLMKREILIKMKQLEEEIKDIMYIGD